ncbi:MAG TPA: ABC transporter permease subunit, partial [Methylocella sp.]|nr:ABC transporter permease subunit [Methylocella sp.]
QLLFRPLVAFGARFRVELSAGQIQEKSFVAQVFARTHWMRALMRGPAQLFQTIALLRMELPARASASVPQRPALSRMIDILWVAFVVFATIWAGSLIIAYIRQELSWSDVWQSALYTIFTMVRVILLMALATLVWVPVGVWIGLRPALAEKVQPLAQFLAAFPANVVFPVAVILILKFSLNPDIWLSFLIIFGTQWYILFNVIAGASAFPNDLKEAVSNFQIRGWNWWKNVIIPGIFPYYVTGALTASGGSWNAAIVAEYVKWGNDTVSAHGIGAYIAEATAVGDYPKIVLGVAMMSIFVIMFNRLLWRPLFTLAERRLLLD